VRAVTTLRLDSNQLQSLDGVAQCCPALQQLDANDNQLESMRGVQGLAQLVVLQLGDNAISEVEHEHLSALPALRVLNLGGNELEGLAGFRNGGKELRVGGLCV
jgi:Leucine-rich repeat (LRR) protein